MPARADDLPEGWKTLEIGQVLTCEQIAKVSEIVELNREDGMKLIDELKQYLRTLQSQLDKHELLADYLAYVLFAKIKNLV